MRIFAVSVFLTAAIVSAGCGRDEEVSNAVAPGADDYERHGPVPGPRSRQGCGQRR